MLFLISAIMIREMNKDMKKIMVIMNAWSVNEEMVDGWNRNEDIEMIT